GEVDVAAERAKVSAAIAGGVPEAAAMARFRERTGQDFTVQPAVASPAGINPNALKLAQPQNFADFEAQQETLKPAVEAKGWEWQPDRFNYSVDANGQIQRELSPGRRYLKANYDALIEHQKILQGK